MATNGGGPTRPNIEGVDPRKVLYFAIFPNCLISLHPDYVMLHTLWPRGAGRTEVVCEWFFEPGVTEHTDAVEFWDLVNRQDWAVCESVQRGMTSRSYRHGWFAPMEDDSLDIRRWLLPRLESRRA